VICVDATRNAVVGGYIQGRGRRDVQWERDTVYLGTYLEISQLTMNNDDGRFGFCAQALAPATPTLRLSR
jgi:hypothetical protein